MKILHRYVLKQWIRSLSVCLLVSAFLFFIIEFFDQIDNIAAEDPEFHLVLLYFLFKIPLTISLMLPVAVLVTTLFTFGMLARNSEITAMRSSGVTLFWIAKPIFITGLFLSLASILFNETIIPYSARRTHEIYNIDIRKKDQIGIYNQENVWWRSGEDFYSISMFDSRNKTLLGFSRFQVNDEFDFSERTDATRVRWVDENLGWSMHDITEYEFNKDHGISKETVKSSTLPITEKPEYFYDVRLDPEIMSYRGLRNYMAKLAVDGISILNYRADLYSKLAFPFINFIVILAALPFALKPARSGNLGASFCAGITIGFLYYVVHSFSISLGRSELLPPLLAAWMANFLLGFVGLVLNWGAEAP